MKTALKAKLPCAPPGGSLHDVQKSQHLGGCSSVMFVMQVKSPRPMKIIHIGKLSGDFLHADPDVMVPTCWFNAHLLVLAPGRAALCIVLLHDTQRREKVALHEHWHVNVR